ncbi:Ribonuclease H-like superfamily [Sesbania bispinosa]|nr:Ribonuclease H-like superfamily [Sesbania bispinosa]
MVWLGCGRLSSLVDSIHPVDRYLQRRILSFNPPIGTSDPNNWFWSAHALGVYSAKSTFTWLHKASFQRPPTDWKWIWRLPIPEKLKFFIWVILHNALPTNSFRLKRKITSDGSWGSLRRYSSLFAGLRNATSIHGHCFLATLWWIWRWRNNLAMDAEKWHIDRVLFYVKTFVQDFQLCASSKDIYDVFIARSRSFWLPPPNGVIKVNIDGNFSVSSHLAGMSVVIRSDSAEWIFGVSGFSHARTSLHTELLAVHMGLLSAWENDYRNLICETDSLSAIQLINAEFRSECQDVSLLVDNINSLIV